MKNITEEMQSQGKKPHGFIGTLVGRIMNRNHSKIYWQGLKKIKIKTNFVSLDIGCGGGELIRILTKMAPEGKICGIDHSEEMIKLTQKRNPAARVEIRQASVSNIPYEDKTFDLVTAFETIQFWPDLKHDLREINRVLKENGFLLIANRYPEEGSKWGNFLQIKNANQYQQLLAEAGFKINSTDLQSQKGWILISAQKI